MSKVTSCEPHVDISIMSQNAILPCASPSNSSTHIIAKFCDELLSMPCCSNNETLSSSSTCVVTNHVEDIKELKAQVTSFSFWQIMCLFCIALITCVLCGSFDQGAMHNCSSSS